MNVLYVTDANLALRRSHVVTIVKTAEALGRAGARVVVSAPRATSGGASVSRETIAERHGVDLRFVDMVFRRKGILNSVRLVLEMRADWLYYRDPHFLLCGVLAKLCNKKIAIELHRTPRNVIEHMLWRWSVRLADRVIVITRALQDALPYGKDKVHVVYGGNYEPELARVFRNTPKGELRKSLQLPTDKTLITYTGNTISYRFDELFAAVASLHNVMLVIVGVTEERQLLEKVRQCGVEDKLILVGRTDREKSISYLFASDILAVPFVSYEPGAFPFKIFEYMGTGVPIVSFRNACIEEVLRDQKNALLVDGEKSVSWQQALERLMNDRTLGERVAAQALNDVHVYTWEARGKTVFSVLSKQP